MRNTSKVQQGQSLIDKTLELTGSIENLLSLSILNHRSITDDISIGDLIISENVTNQTIINQLSLKPPATAILKEKHLNIQDGIDYWALEYDFIIE